ncbi:MAG: hemerythrin domain-containing protein [Cellulosilyticum sp.]|nr:hemerythrin domain-containing protein [Cellulosilyticum sp.]
MNSIEVMVKEHELISRMLKVMRKACYEILKGEEVCTADLYEMADFVKYYADKHHHDKEEKFLFKAMEEHLGALGQKLIRGGMLVEHDLGRLYMSDLREALQKFEAGEEESKLDIIANMISYTHLLERHIAKENEVVYTFGEKQLAPSVLEEIHAQAKVYEEEAMVKGIQEKYKQVVEKFEAKYL